MRLLIGVLLCFFDPISCGWFRDLLSPKGWHLGDGLVVHLTNSTSPNSTFLERHSINMDYGGYGISVNKIPGRKALEVGLYTRFGEARDKKDSIFNFIIGYKMASIGAVVVSVVGAFVLKALMVAKLAAVTSTILLLLKLFHHRGEEQESPKHIEVEALPELHEEWSEMPPSAIGYYPSASANYQSYASFQPIIDYGGVETSAANNTFPGIPANQQVGRRRYGTKRRRVPLVTIHQYTIKS